ncbi:uncharacterized protein SETTUDRAFT_25864 [Exserohilum turcica Et28A]|uniref:F-box domain-containing protein n=1 Tax=Exserohilum turcicum (strain 28A) TaxID=671987 RepID=R0IYB2_EXST2|nr:uncharacterized protein SETTUDRAFT_25864 [Exserohilum turcica Et28A]EOA89541.1 hypothetical protein SETTUDRAFT_25864 [Exserohilum turcica Et28A]
MPLLELPLEVFEHITHFLVGSLEVTKVVQYRKVCRTFDRCIVEEICDQAS